VESDLYLGSLLGATQSVRWMPLLKHLPTASRKMYISCNQSLRIFCSGEENFVWKQRRRIHSASFA